MTRPERSFVGVLCLIIPIVLGLAWWLIPDPGGFGTHRQLGLPGCTFYSLTGVRCPHCGMTTSVCWMVRGQIGRSLDANPAGLLFGVTLVISWPWCVVAASRGKWIGVWEPGRSFLSGVGVWLLFSLISWILRLWNGRF